MLAEHGVIDPGEVTRRHVQQYINLQAEHRKGAGVLGCYKCLRVFFRHYAGEVRGCEMCMDRETFRSHSCSLTPVHGVRKPRPSEHPSKVVPVLNDDQWAAVLKAAGDGRTLTSARNRAMLLLLADSGLRRAELHALNVGDVDLDTHVVLVKRGKGGKKRVSVFGDQARLAVKRYLKLRKDKPGPDSRCGCPPRAGGGFRTSKSAKSSASSGRRAGSATSTRIRPGICSLTRPEMGIVASGASFGIFCEHALPAVQHAALRKDRSNDGPRTMGDLVCHHLLASGRTMMQPVRLHRTPA
jgi:hypothetical protein